MKILVLFTGGTIGSFKVNHNGHDVIGTKSELRERGIDVTGLDQLLIEKYKKNNLGDNSISFEAYEIADILSENMTIPKWNEITDKLREINFNNYDGVIITHGTDTLGYFANYMAMILNNVEVPVVIVSSNYELNDERANGNFNFQSACDFIKEELPGVFVSYRNNLRDNTRIIYGSRVLQCSAPDNTFPSITCHGDVPLAEVTNNGKVEYRDYDLYWILKARESFKGRKSVINSFGDINSNILRIEPYVGINYDSYNLRNVDGILHGLYHSGTACTDINSKNNIISFNKMANNSNTDLYVGPFYGKDAKALYATSKDMLDAGIKFVTNTSSENAYVKLLLAYTLAIKNGVYPNKISAFVEDFMNKNINEEFIQDPIKIKTLIK